MLIKNIFQAFELSKWLVHWFPAWQGLVISIDVAQWHVYFPTMSLMKLDASALESASSVDKVCVRLPIIQICSASSSNKHSQLFITAPSKLPVRVPTSAWVEGTIFYSSPHQINVEKSALIRF